MDIRRRKFLELVLAGTLLGPAASAIAGDRARHSRLDRWSPRPSDREPGTVFRHGVASGDPLEDRVVLWTRITPESDRVVPVTCEVATDPDMRRVVACFRGTTGSYRDFTVKVDARALWPGRTYYYRFIARREASPIGRTRTLPRETDHVRLGLASCANWATGYFAAYRHLANRQDLDAVIHVGDYIYEYANDTYGDGTKLDRIPSPDKELVALDDYRTRYAQYRSDPDLQAAHRAHPWIVVWDDHEIANDAWRDGAENHNADEAEGDWATRKRAAAKAWLEWMPIRDPSWRYSGSDRIFRSFQFGDLVTLDMLDTRHFGRDEPIPALIDPATLEVVPLEGTRDEVAAEITRRIAGYGDPARHLLGAEQEAWLWQQLLEPSSKSSKWHVLGQQVMMGQLTLSDPALPAGIRAPLAPDQWDGYAAARERLLGFVKSNDIGNVVVLTGDIHSSWANNIALDPYRATYDAAVDSTAVELVCPGISSPFFIDGDAAVAQRFECIAVANNPHTRFVDFEHNGYVIVDIDRYRTSGEWYHLDDVQDPVSAESLAAAVTVEAGHGFISQVDDTTGLASRCTPAATGA
jgi:alkaline phosphatase D